jgi:hypothetical protein
MKHTRVPQTEAALTAMNARNQARAEIIKRVLGDKYLLHPANIVQRRPSFQ